MLQYYIHNLKKGAPYYNINLIFLIKLRQYYRSTIQIQVWLEYILVTH